MGAQTKKKTRSFSLTDEEFAQVHAGVKRHGFADRNEYLLALVHADTLLHLTAELDAAKRKVLIPSITPEDILRRLRAADTHSSDPAQSAGQPSPVFRRSGRK